MNQTTATTNGLNMYLNLMVHGSIPTEGKNSTRDGGGKDREMAVSGPPKMVGSELLHNSTQITAKEYF
jgi:hypothetical protein